MTTSAKPELASGAPNLTATGISFLHYFLNNLLFYNLFCQKKFSKFNLIALIPIILLFPRLVSWVIYLGKLTLDLVLCNHHLETFDQFEQGSQHFCCPLVLILRHGPWCKPTIPLWLWRSVLTFPVDLHIDFSHLIFTVKHSDMGEVERKDKPLKLGKTCFQSGPCRCY